MKTNTNINLSNTQQSQDYLTPPSLIAALGLFDLDPCCPPNMPWSTANYMVRQGLDLVEDGLQIEWYGRIWCNPPYDNIFPFAERMAKHGNGIMLLPARSTDAKWGQFILKNADAILFLAGRLLYHFSSGEQSLGKWMPNMLAAFGAKNIDSLRAISIHHGWPGVLMCRL